MGDDIFFRRLSISESPDGGELDNQIPGYSLFFLITLIGIGALLLSKKYQQ
ncbi:MAG: Loki-CTERM sorting domain-containing protein [Promethearchaeati archaeon]